MMNNDLIKDADWYWTVGLSVGVDSIDEDHKMLFQLFHEVYSLSQKNTDNSQLYGLANECIHYTESHFKREEVVMLASNYPFCENHFAVHTQLIHQLKQKIHLMEANNESALEFLVFLRDRFIQHIKGSDQRISNYTQGCEQAIQQALEKIGPLTIKQDSTIYLVDDDEAYIELMQAMVDAAGLKCIAYYSGNTFLTAKITNNDLIVLDLNMPEKDGIEVMRELTERNLSPTFILISGFDERVLHSAKQFAESKQLKVAETLTKPIEVDDFIDILIKVHSECQLDYLSLEIKAIQTTENPEETAVNVHELIIGLEQCEFDVYIQPQVFFKDGSLSGGEILVRWQHPIRGLVFPDQFIPLAEQHHLMGELTEIIIKQTVIAYKQLQVAGIDIPLSINLSAQNINDLTLPEKLNTLLKENGIAPEAFTLELTESAILTDTSAALDILNRLRMKGFSLSIDDFGTGDSSLKRLYQSPFSELKIDQHFVRRIEKDSDANSIVKICTLLAKEFKMHTVAEGVETQEIWAKLKALHCDIAQGYFISKPIPVPDFIKWANQYEKIN